MSKKYPLWFQADDVIKQLVRMGFNIHVYQVRETGDIVISYLDRDLVRKMIPAAEMDNFNMWYNNWVNWFQSETDVLVQLNKMASLPMNTYGKEMIRQAVGKCMRDLESRIDCTLDESLFRSLT